MNNLLEFLNKLKSAIGALPTPQKILYAGLLLVLLSSVGFMVYAVNRVDYTPLYSRLSDEDMGGVVETLKAKKIPYRLSADNSVSVPRESVYETRLALATEGVPKGSGIGFEIFDQQKLGSTEFVQKINYQRALQGELARTITGMDEVAECRVHLVLTSESLFVEDQKPPSAAVVLKLESRAKLKPQQVQGIVNLVAGAVQGLKEENVTIMSTDGQVLFKKSQENSSLQLTNLQVQYKSNMEEELRRKVQSMLEPIVGVNRVLARVSVDSDFNQVEISEDKYDPDSAVIRSQQRSVDNVQGGEAGAKGNPDAPINLESQLMQSSTPPDGKQQQKTSNRQRETVNYEINRVSRKITQAPGALKKVSVAVILDGPYDMKPNDQGKTAPVFAGYSQEQLKSLEEVIKKAVGYDEGRGDQITLSNIPFTTEVETGDIAAVENRWVKMLKDNQRIILNVVLALLVFIFIVRPFMRKFQQLTEAPKSLPSPQASLPGQQETDTPGLMEPSASGELNIRQKAMALVRQDPERATQIIRAMLREES
jgi:flagellar M-ring protein FliF